MREKQREVEEGLAEDFAYFLELVPRPEPHQFYINPERLHHLRAKVYRHQYCIRKKIKNADKHKASESERQELDELERQGFGNWNVEEYRRFVYYSGNYGRLDIESVSEHIEKKAVEAVYRYAVVFWNRYYELDERQEIMKVMQEGEHRQNIKKLMALQVARDVQKYESYFEVEFSEGMRRHLKNKEQHLFTELVDRYLLWYGSQSVSVDWGQAKERIASDQILSLDSFARTRSEDELFARFLLL